MKGEFLGLKKNSFFFSISNKKGQFAIEAVLLMTVLLGAFLVFTQYVKSHNLIAKLASGSIERVGTMAGYGTWQTECTGQGKSKKQSLGKCHPNSIHRSLSSDPK